MSTAKSTLRKMVKRRLKAISCDALVKASQDIVARLLVLPELMNATVVAMYQDTRYEPSITTLSRKLTSAILTFPRWNQANDTYEMAVVVDMKNDFVPGKYGILEPSTRCRIPTKQEREETVWLVPGMAFDATGGRLGRGGGFYDRLLRFGKNKIGIACGNQMVDSVPTEVHDVRMDLVVTESAIIDCHATIS
jgi:5-formyltetrahydrofolate cyclo-ligase